MELSSLDDSSPRSPVFEPLMEKQAETAESNPTTAEPPAGKLLVQEDAEVTSSEAPGLTSPIPKPAPNDLPETSAQTSLLLANSPDLKQELPTPSAPSRGMGPEVIFVSSGWPPSAETLERLHRDLATESRPASALQRIEAYLQLYAVDEVQQQMILSERQVWLARQAEQLRKFQNDFIPAKELDDADALTLSVLQNFPRLIQSQSSLDVLLAALDQANNAKTAPGSTHYFSGLLRAVWQNETRQAITHFHRTLNEIPNHAGALNNIAICEMKLGNHLKALATWRKALDGTFYLYYRPIIRHNLQYAQHLAVTTRAKTPASFADSIARLLAETPPDAGEPAVSSKGELWKFSPWLGPAEYVAAIRGLPDISLIPTQQWHIGARIHGLALGEDLVLVDWQSLQIPSMGLPGKLRVISPNVSGAQPFGEAVVVACNPELNWALLHCPTLQAPLLELGAQPALAGEAIYFGFRTGTQPPQFQPGQLARAAENPGLPLSIRLTEAGPIGDAMPVFHSRGQLLGILSAIDAAGPDSALRHAWPVATLQEFIKAAPVTPIEWPLAEREGSWESKQNYLGEHLVPVELLYPEESLGLDRLQRSKFNSSHHLHDCGCVLCNRRTVVVCPQKGCGNGKVSVKEKVLVSRTAHGAPVYATKSVSVPCTRCRGTGTVSCPACLDGTTQATRNRSGLFNP